MIPGDIATRLREMIQASVQPVSALTAAQSDAPEDFLPGQRFSALIQNPLPDGTFKALVAGRTITLALPETAKDGDALELVVTGREGQRILARHADTSAQAQPTGDNQPKAQLSQAGQLISQLLTGRYTEQAQAARALPPPLLPGAPDASLLKAPPTPISVNTPLPTTTAPSTPPATTSAPGTTTTSTLTATQTASSAAATASTPTAAPTRLAMIAAHPASPLAAALAPLLRQAISQSGLFYESHQARWLDGEMPLESLRQEPQAQDAEHAPDAARARATAGERADTSNAQRPGNTAPRFEPNAAIARLSAGTAAEEVGETATARQAAAMRIPENVLPVVHQQLDLLATQQFTWLGQLWPGQTLQWQIEDPQGQSNGAQDAEAREWVSTLRLHLPHLGGIDARLALSPAGVSLRIGADSSATVSNLREAQGELAAALDAAGIPLTGMVVNLDEQA